MTTQRQRRAKRSSDERPGPETAARDPRLTLLGQLGNQAAAREIARLRSAERRLSQIKYWTMWILGRHKSLNL